MQDKEFEITKDGGNIFLHMIRKMHQHRKL